MASLRRKPAPDPVSDDLGPIAPTPGPEVSIDTDQPAPVIPQQRENAGPATVSASALREQLDALRNSEQLARQQAVMAGVEQRRAAWVQSNPLAQEHYGVLADLHRDALASNLIDTSPAYFDYLNSRLATLQPRHAPIEEMQTRIAESREPERPQPRQRTPLVSAPVSRETSGGSYNGGYGGSPSRIKLTQAQAEFARLSGISEAEYAKQLLRLREAQQNGEYSQQR